MKTVNIGEIYKITYPNGKIYIGQDRTHDINYFGSANKSIIEEDFHGDLRDDLIIRKEILVRIYNTTIKELNRLEKEYIIKYKSYIKSIGYNRNKYKETKNENCKN